MATPGGFMGAALIVDVSDGTATRLELDDGVLRDHLGGVGLGAWLLRHLGPAGADALAPEAPIAFTFSSLVGTPLTTSAKFAVVARSPLTGMLNDALASSTFAIAGKRTGHDAIVLLGRHDEPCIVAVDGDGTVTLHDGTAEWGLSAADAEIAVKARLGRGWSVAAIGPAGEIGVRYATVSHDGRHAGRGGLGAVMGSKHIKALAVRAGAPPPRLADADAVVALAKDLRARSFGPATAKYRELGTVANLLAFNTVSSLPTRNFRQASFDGAEALAVADVANPDAGALDAARRVARTSCASCTIGCEHIYAARDGTKARVEYENVYALGPLLGVDDGDLVLRASARCDAYGLDTISTGGTIAWAMDCVEHGLLDAGWLRFGDGASVLRAIDEIGTGTGLGPLLGLGSRAAAAQIGPAAEALTVQVKGLELPGYDPRTLHAMALGLAVNARGADHNRSGAYQADLSGEVDRSGADHTHVAAVIEHEDRAAAMDSMILCKFLRGVFEDPWEDWAGLLRPITGWADLDGEALRETAQHIVMTKRRYNAERGWVRSDDTLPARLLDERVVLASGREGGLTRQQLDFMVEAYYLARGLQPDGTLTPR